MKLTTTLLTIIALAVNLPLNGFAAEDMTNAGVTEIKSSDTTTISEGEVKKIDKNASKMTIKHGPLVNLDMPGMTMVFRVKDPAMLEQVKTGDKIKFVAEKINGSLTLTTLEPAK